MKTALVTGCSSGIGLYTAIALAKDGYAVHATMRDTSKDAEIRSVASKESVDVLVSQLDVSDEASISSAITSIAEQSGTIDVLVNNAGFGQFGAIEDTAMSDFRSQFDTNYFGVVSIIQKVLPYMRSQKSGRIINIGSVVGRMGLPCSPAYISSKFALEGLTECLRYEVDQFNIQATVIEPGVIKTQFIKSMKIAQPSNEVYTNMLNHIMSGLEMMVQMGTDPKVVADAVLDAIHEESMQPRYVVGADANMFVNVKKSRTDAEFEDFMKKEVFPQ
ncbi:MAG: SDR family oxidoreductase [Cenarchaeum sp. SB0665_bin_23]|nr:SDR family oxidoreductase [Cenarchaeum sp. SB0667_bin_13]MXY61693.1 SDR family oxidoreductase [Cenarchaeum sp. SB0665_bin_23]MXZ93242.1 SDR family oxidoreductase [Cenarchaeum sp. SB0666_bin_15]MYB47225.1 SDR family oxidoreductase [Cenarchaeum sp. SB0662_bin_33]MYC79355.1 SDR family oxidoreductase [Cenarchaeum sp. SB0661_bin_35]MYD59161.1 SDR family oxidoreductase [Cenarchaeum sp. SB0678_bin_8]MYG32804.1 SDR family oxidoreductase [Cenarchaeum sp. SB0677_bin_16]MYI51595.1 SDR family oxidore